MSAPNKTDNENGIGGSAGTTAASRRCVQCKNRLIQKSDAGITFRIDGPVSIDKDGVCHARCWSCKSAVAIPLELAKSFSLETERVVVLTRAPNTSNFAK